MAQINEQPPDLPSTVSEPVRRLVLSCIAKKPGERPATASALAQAARALRRGDVAAATIAVPAIGAAAATPADVATQAFNAQDATTQLFDPMATRAQSAAGGAGAGYVAGSADPDALRDGDDEPADEKKRSPWFWPLIVLAVLAVIALVVGIVFAVGNTDDPAPAPTTSSSTPSPTRTTPTPTPTSTSVTVTSGDYVGLTEAAARAALEELGLQVDSADAGSSAPSPDQVGTVASIDPTGALEKGSSVTIYVYRAAPTPAQPSTPTATPGQIAAGETATINWPAYSGCPTGYSLTGYSYTITGGTDTSGQSAGGLGANATSLTVTASAAGNLTVSYVANCGQIASEPSPGVTITVTAPATTPAPSPSDGSDPQ